MKPKSVFSQQGNKSAIDLSKLIHPSANKSRTGKIFSLENVCPKITKPQNPKTPWPGSIFGKGKGFE